MKPRRKFTLPGQSPAQGTTCTIGGAVNRHVKITFGIFNDHGRGRFKAHLDQATLVVTPTRPVDIGKPNDDTSNGCITMGKRVGKPIHDVVANAIGEIETLTLNIHLHLRFPYQVQNKHILRLQLTR